MFGSSATGSSGAGPVSRSVPRLSGRTIPPSSVKPLSGPSIHGSYIGTMKWIGWMSGTGRSGSRAPEEMRLARGQTRRRRADLALRAEDHRRQKVVVQVLADAGQVGDDVDPERAQVLRGPDAGEQEELRRSDRSAAHDDLLGAGPLDAAVLRPLDADAAGAVEQRGAGRIAPGDELEGVRRLDGTDVRRRRAVAHAVLDAVLHERHAVLRHAVVVRVQRRCRTPARPAAIDTWIAIRLERREEAHRSGPAGLAPLDALVDRAARPPTTSPRRRDTPTYRSRRVRRAPRSSRSGSSIRRAPCRAATRAGVRWRAPAAPSRRPSRPRTARARGAGRGRGSRGCRRARRPRAGGRARRRRRGAARRPRRPIRRRRRRRPRARAHASDTQTLLTSV